MQIMVFRGSFGCFLNILFLTLGSIESRGIYTDLMQEIKYRGNEVYVVTSIERKNNQELNAKTQKRPFNLKH